MQGCNPKIKHSQILLKWHDENDMKINWTINKIGEMSKKKMKLTSTHISYLITLH